MTFKPAFFAATVAAIALNTACAMDKGKEPLNDTDAHTYRCEIVEQYIGPNGPEFYDDGRPVQIVTPYSDPRRYEDYGRPTPTYTPWPPKDFDPFGIKDLKQKERVDRLFTKTNDIANGQIQRFQALDLNVFLPRPAPEELARPFLDRFQINVEPIVNNAMQDFNRGLIMRHLRNLASPPPETESLQDNLLNPQLQAFALAPINLENLVLRNPDNAQDPDHQD